MALREQPPEQTTQSTIHELNETFAKDVGLRYVSDVAPGFKRKRAGKGFTYVDYQNNRVTHDATLNRIKSLVLPPAWNSVWICRYDNGHLQATGRDQRERKQYRYHEKWNKERNENKFSKLETFGEALPKIRSQLERDLKLDDLSRDNVLAAVVRIMEKTMIRIGNDEYAEENDSYGLTTIRNDHVKIKGSESLFCFKGKSGVIHESTLDDKKLTSLIKRCQHLPGQELFGYKDESGNAHDIESGDVNSYLKNVSGESITAKDYRTWGATVHAAKFLFEKGPLEKQTQVARKKRELEAIKSSAEFLGNTTAVCRKYYIHPIVFEADADGELVKAFKRAHGTSRMGRAELAILDILKHIR